ncbi:helix-turn-helix domain-containing protein [Peribacillus frigoritolerans]|uniref:helix-turn-helix domain-containing protein n=1 Tax=Peribacillus frigoritolerans TaxID=450367 RepID=UPI0025A238B7|nr:helix-turn-helix domain-containing protein [Peribacillus frigoritolerans]MDM5313374.1 helix-turn-helix domain-containing protein [Peribacillus frigoritolerans]
MSVKRYEKEVQKRYEDYLDNLLFEALEAYKMPEKLGINHRGDFITLYPNPVFTDNKVSRIEYKPNQIVKLPKELAERHTILKNEIAKAKNKALKGKSKAGRPSKPFAEAVVIQWIQLREQGLTYGEIAKQFGTSKTTVSNYLKKYKKRNAEAVAN